MKYKITIAAVLTVLFLAYMVPVKQHVTLPSGDGDGVQDAVFSLLVPNNNYGTLEDIHLYAWTQSGALNVNRVALQFDLSAVPSAATIHTASLSLHFNPTSKYGKLLSPAGGHMGRNAFRISRITSAWDESRVTWATQPESAESQFIRVAEAESPTQDYSNIPVTALVQEMVTQPEHSFGFLLKHEFEQPYAVTILASSNHPQESLRPQLTVEYSANYAQLLDRQIRQWLK